MTADDTRTGNSTTPAVPDEAETPAVWENLIAAFLMFISSLIGLITYSAVVYVIFRDFKTKFKNSFYPFVVSLAFSDMIMLVLFLFYSVPLTLTQSWPLGETFDIIMGMICEIGFYSSLPCISVIALNRYWAICRYETYEKVFSPKNVKIIIFFLWIFGVFAPNIPISVPNFCTIRYYPPFYTWSYDMSLWGCIYFIYFERICVGITGLSLILSYVSIFAKRRQQNKVAHQIIRNNAQVVERQKSETRLALNFLIVAVYLMVFDIVFTTLPEFTFYRWYNLITSLMYILNSSINPYIYIAFNKNIQASLRSTLMGKLLGLKRETTTAAVHSIPLRNLGQGTQGRSRTQGQSRGNTGASNLYGRT